MKVMVTGAGGMAGSELAREAHRKGWECVALARADLDVADRGEVDRLIAREHPDVIVNAAGYTAVDSAEDSPEEAMAVNGAGAGNIATSAERHGAAVVHISTDYVFDGSGTKPYRPGDAVAPLGVYGESKLAGEIEVREKCERHAIIRTSWVYSHEGRNFVRTMLRLAGERDRIRVVNDQRGSPTSAADLARALARVAERLEENSSATGTYHFCNAGITTWYEFALAVFELRGNHAPEIVPVATEDFPAKARRPRWSVLDTSSFVETFGLSPRPWRAALADTMAKLT
jgi:dTDP-4-dehydrorhamnose reductase